MYFVLSYPVFIFLFLSVSFLLSPFKQLRSLFALLEP